MEQVKAVFGRYKQLIAGVLIGVVAVLAGLSAVVAAGGGSGEEGEIENIAPGALSVTDEEARSIVLEEYPDATIQEVELEMNRDGSISYEIEISTGQEIEIDARSGEILGVEIEDDDDGDDDDDDGDD